MTQKQKNDILIVAAILLGALFLIKALFIPAIKKSGGFISNANTVLEDRAHKVNEPPKSLFNGQTIDTIKPTR